MADRLLLATKLYKLGSFQRQYKLLLVDSVLSLFPNIYSPTGEKPPTDGYDWANLLTIASILSQSNKIEHLDAALRISQHCLNSPHSLIHHKKSSVYILNQLTNKPAVDLAIKRQLIPSDHRVNMPLPLEMDMLKNEIKYSITTSDNRIILLNKFQHEVFEKFSSFKHISISAPTSIGKSYVLYQLMFDLLRTKNIPTSLIYLVPTRALIAQVENDLREVFSKDINKKIIISTIPAPIEKEDLNKSKIFIFTQERLHWFVQELTNYNPELFIVDEAQKIQDGHRGILLQEKIEQISSIFPNMQIIYSSPFVKNPELLLETTTVRTTKTPITAEFASVNQNLIFVSQRDRKPQIWDVELVLKEDSIPLGEIHFYFRPHPDSKRFIFAIKELADPTGGNLIYTPLPSDAEKISLQLFGTIDDSTSGISDKLKDLIKLVQKVVHKKYRLAKTLTKGIAFHYGNMPLIIRDEIEKLFKQGEIKYLICTSTLLEGVNLPTKNLFLRKPKRSKSIPLSPSDFWNLAGRAGRWGKEFQGSIICVEPSKWDFTPTQKDKKKTIQKAIDIITSEKSENLLRYIQDGTPRQNAKKNQDLEYATTYFYNSYLITGKNSKSIQKLPNYGAILKEFRHINETVIIPSEILFKNPGISPIAQQKLLMYFYSYKFDPSQLIPDFPESDNAVSHSYIPIIEIINEYLSGDPVELAYYQAVLVVNWMKGLPLSKLIDSSYKYWAKKGIDKKIDTVIRDTMKDVEEFARFKFAKYSSCYIDILKYFFTETGRMDLIDEIPQLNIWLEFGVAQQTQLSLIGIGLSRHTAIMLSEYINNDRMTQKECREWIMSTDLNELDLPPLMAEEIELKIK